LRSEAHPNHGVAAATTTTPTTPTTGCNGGHEPHQRCKSNAILAGPHWMTPCLFLYAVTSS
jgi:hypothetical protein